MTSVRGLPITTHQVQQPWYQMSGWPYGQTAHFLLRFVDVAVSAAANHQALDARLG